MMYKYSLHYEKSETVFVFHGNHEELLRFKKNNPKCKLISGSNDHYTFIVQAECYITRTDDNGNLNLKYPKSFICKHYNKQNVYKKDFRKLLLELIKGTISWDDIT